MPRPGVTRFLAPLVPGLLLIGLCGAPLAVGGVHSVTIGLVTGACLIALALLFFLGLVTGRALRGGRMALPLLVLLLWPALQAVPLPPGVRVHLDPVGSELLGQDDATPTRAAFPLSLDPAETRKELALAAAALAVFLVALNLSKGRRGMARPLLRVIAAAGGVALVIALAQGIVGIDQVYGAFGPPPSSLLVGPFVNPNHFAQFLELCCFVALAVAVQAPSRGARLAWIGLAAALGIACLATLSRGAVVALGGGAAVFLGLAYLRFRRNRESDETPWRTVAGKLLLALGFATLVGGVALALGAGTLVDEFRSLDASREGEKLLVWQQSLLVLKQHPMGVGRGAFDDVFPVHRPAPALVTQDFVENEPLQHLIELGWPGFLILLLATGFALWRFEGRSRRDTVEMALLGGLTAVFLHNVFDFGWELSGIRLPVVAVAGIAFGRSLRSGHHEGPSRILYLHVPAALLLGTVGVASHWQRSGADFDRLLLDVPASERRVVAIEAARHHPADYHYPLTQARFEATSPGPDGRSPRLAALNRAARRCPTCYAVQGAIASGLWAAGRRDQAVLQWQITFDLWPGSAGHGVAELLAGGITAQELAKCRPQELGAILTITNTLISLRAATEAEGMIEWARARGLSNGEAAVLRGELALAIGAIDEAAEAFARARAHLPRSPRVFLGLAAVARAQKTPEGALAFLREGVAQAPENAKLATQMLELVVEQALWHELDPALSAVMQANDGSPAALVAAHLLAANAHEARGNVRRAIQEYEGAAILQPENVEIWRRMGMAAERSSDVERALSAYRELLRLQPKDGTAQETLTRLEAAREQVNRDMMLQRPPSAEGL